MPTPVRLCGGPPGGSASRRRGTFLEAIHHKFLGEPIRHICFWLRVNMPNINKLAPSPSGAAAARPSWLFAFPQKPPAPPECLPGLVTPPASQIARKLKLPARCSLSWHATTGCGGRTELLFGFPSKPSAIPKCLSGLVTPDASQIARKN